MRVIASCVRRHRWAAAVKDLAGADAFGVKMTMTMAHPPSFGANARASNRALVGAFERGKQTSAGKREDESDDGASASASRASISRARRRAAPP